MSRTLTWSYGGGVQSVAIGVLVAQGKLPRPDMAAICDTGREMASTFTFLRDHMQPFLNRSGVGIEIQVVPHSLSHADLYYKTGLTLIPAYTKTEDGVGLFGDMSYREGRLAAFCSGHWKRDTMERWLRLQGVESCDQWIGYSLDEWRRRKNDHRKWCHLVYPLIDLKITRDDCKRLISEAGLPVPKKSRCWMCPHQNDEEWQEVKDSPEEFAMAVALEKEINDRDPDSGGDLFLYPGRVPLELAKFDGSKQPERACNEGGCWT